MKLLGTVFFLASASLSFGYDGTNPQKIWSEISSDIYNEIPTIEVTTDRLKETISHRAKATIDQKDDLLPRFDKLLHSNGVCLKGKWKITEETPYSGYFKKGSEAIVIARASTTLSGVKRGDKRGFAFALKLFPTEDFNTNKKLKSANIFTIDNLTGNYVSHFLKSEMTNAPSFGLTGQLELGARVAAAFFGADLNPMVRQLYQVSELGEKDLENIVTPFRFKIVGAKGQGLSPEEDFRHEIIDALEKNRGLSFDLKVRTMLNLKYKTIGAIEFDEAIASDSCDHRLHFNHPKWRSDLNFVKF